MTRRLSFASQALLLQLGVLLAVLLAGVALVALLLQRELEDQYEQRALGIARSVAADPAYAVDIASHGPSPAGDVELRAEAVRRRTEALFVVVTDDAGRRYSHPNTALIGQRVSTDPTAALAGRDVVALERGTLGLSARGKVPLRNTAGDVMGEVSVGIDARAVHHRLMQLVRATLGFGGVALLIGAAGSLLLSRRLKRQTLGLEPAELADLVREHEAVLHGIENGVVAVEDGRISMTNDEACRLLGADVRPGAGIDVLPPRLARVVSAREEVTDVLVVHGDRTLVVSTRPVERHGRDLGTVVTVQDRTQLEHLTRELETVQTLFDALRAQAHEHTNRLHALQGMLHLGHVQQAEEYLRELADAAVPGQEGELQVTDPYLRGLLVAKGAVAAERGVQLRLSEDSYLAGRLTAPLDVVTVLGNLLDNAIRAAAAGARRPAWVEVALAADDTAMHCAVTDSGAGLPGEAVDRAFDDGWTTQPDDGRAHGLGLALARQAARRHDGDVQVLAASGTDHGAVFSAQLRHVLAAAVPAP